MSTLAAPGSILLGFYLTLSVKFPCNSKNKKPNVNSSLDEEFEQGWKLTEVGNFHVPKTLIHV